MGRILVARGLLVGAPHRVGGIFLCSALTVGHPPPRRTSPIRCLRLPLSVKPTMMTAFEFAHIFRVGGKAPPKRDFTKRHENPLPAQSKIKAVNYATHHVEANKKDGLFREQD
mmetsp:Transcript_20084/g.49972  ORF Transcript_20084/g.49972 Transcript_20084/m.49972 type:complete len:113 (-) Transcript_20084:34-372(-)